MPDLSWLDHAACRGRDTEMWFAATKDGRRVAAAFCHLCPVAQQCLDYGVVSGSEGLWGGVWLRSANARRLRPAPPTSEELRARQREAKRRSRERNRARQQEYMRTYYETTLKERRAVSRSGWPAASSGS